MSKKGKVSAAGYSLAQKAAAAVEKMARKENVSRPKQYSSSAKARRSTNQGEKTKKSVGSLSLPELFSKSKSQKVTPFATRFAALREETVKNRKESKKAALSEKTVKKTAKAASAEKTGKSSGFPYTFSAGKSLGDKAQAAVEKKRNSQYLPVSDFRISSLFGVDRGDHRHSGIDLAVPVGTKVAAAKSGEVSFAGWGNGYGYRVIIDHPDGTQTTYNHLSDIGVKVGDKVTAGKTVALSGNTGNSTGPHLHFEVKVNGKYVDPETYYDFGNGLRAKDSGNFQSQLSVASGAAKSSGASSGTKSSGSSVRSSGRSSVGTKVKRITLPTALTAHTAENYFNAARALAAVPTEDFTPRRSGSVNYFSADLNPLLELMPTYRIRKGRS